MKDKPCETPVASIGKYKVYQLDKETATCYIDSIVELVNYIPMKEYTREEVLGDYHPARTIYGKWQHSLIGFDGSKPIAVLIAYERQAEDHPGYRENSIYISELAVDKAYRRQGIAREMLKIFFRHSSRFQYLRGAPVYTIQTNAAKLNEPVQNLYESFGYEPAGTKKYENRTDVVLKKRPT
ncbi:MAG: GNAT family N-acetyltransferase [Bacteroidales bacterium]|nr:GNAT family N-acetyltransferase [Bacteroidales bacterium]